MANILIVDDERSICELLEITFRKEGHRVEIATSGELGRRRLEAKLFDIIISDIRMPDMSGVDLLAHAKEVAPSTVFLLITGVPTVAPQSSRILITGESGTGKELVARAVHENSTRAQAPFITVNCGAFPETLLESELFGYLKGAFTGANENRQGLFQAAHGGTLFLDEIGNMSPTMQVKLYRVLQEGKVRPLGSTEEIDIDVRVIAATNHDLEKAIAAGEFREDLFYRLSVIPIHLPPLRERRDDIPLLARTFLERFRKSMEKPIEGIEPAAMAQMEAYDWPGNVRELENTMERSVALATGRFICFAVIPEKIRYGAAVTNAASADSSTNGRPVLPEGGLDLERYIQ